MNPQINFNQSILLIFHEDPKESVQLMENGHPIVPVKY